MDNDKTFIPIRRSKVLFSNDFRMVLICQETTIVEQRILVSILECVKDKQDLFINKKSLLNDESERLLSFDDCYDGWANQGVVKFEIPIKDLNRGKKMKNSVIQTSLVNMTNINWLRLKDDRRNGFKAVPFILEPGWNRSHIYFNMDKAVLRNLLNMSKFYQIKTNLPFEASTPNTLKFLMWLIIYKKVGIRIIEFQKLLIELFLPKNKYEGRLRFERDYLINVKADLDSFNDFSFKYTYKEGKYTFIIYHTQKIVSHQEKFKTLNDLKISRTLKYLEKKRNLNEGDLRVLKMFYDIRGHTELSSKLNSRIEPSIKGTDYIKAVVKVLDE